MIYIILLINGLIWGFLSSHVGEEKEMFGVGFILGFLLGPIGLIIVIFAHGNQNRCKFCKKYIHYEAVACPYCTRDLPSDSMHNKRDGLKQNVGNMMCPECKKTISANMTTCPHCANKIATTP